MKNRNKFITFVFFVFLCLFQFLHISEAQEVKRSITLEDAYNLVIKTHERIIIAEKEVEKSRLLPKKAMTLMMPTISLNGRYNRLDEAIEYQLQPIECVPEEQWHGKFEVSQPIYQASFFPRRQQAFQAIDRSVESYYQTNQEILFQVALAYYQVLKTKKFVQNAKEILKLAEEEFRVSRVRMSVGAITEDVLIKSELNVTIAQSKLIESSNQFKLSKDILKILIGMETGEYDVVEPPVPPGLREDYEMLINKAFKHRHDYRIAFLNIGLAASDVELVKARFHPTIDASWNYNWIDEPAFDQDDQYWIASLKIKFPLFEGSLRIWDLKEKQTSLYQARLAVEEMIKTIQIEVENAIVMIQTHESILNNLRKQVELSQKNYNITFTQFEFGSATGLELNQALTALYSAKTELITKTYDYYTALINLEKTIGIFAQDFITGIDHKN